MAFLKPLNNNIKQLPIWSFDIETYGSKNKFLMGSILGDDNIKELFWDKHKMIDFLVKYRRTFKQGFIFATNLNFDSLALFQHTDYMNKIYPVIRNSQMLALRILVGDRQYIKMLDSWNFCKMSVKTMGEIVNTEKLSQPRCFKRKPRDEEERIELEKYNLRDSLITYKFMKLLQKGFNDLNANMKITVSSTAMDLFRRNYQDRIFFQPNRWLLKYLYKAYYGGRTEAIKRGHVKNLNYYDVNSLYPSVMIREYPETSRFTYSKVIKHSTIQEYEGVADVIIESPDLYIPYLPFRSKEKLIFPTGIFRGSYTFFELRKALELGYRIHKFIDGIIYFRKFYPFKEYVEKLYAIRKEYKSVKDRRELIIKLMLNSLYGKFAQKIDSKEKIIHVDNVSDEMLKKADKVFRSGKFFVFNEPYKKIPAFVNPIFSLYTTAYARDVLYDYMLKNENKIYYFDTDSLFMKGELDTGLGLGEMKKELSITDGIIVKPKMYLINDYVKCKGIFHINKMEFMDLLINKKYDMERFVKFKEANKRGLSYNEIITITKLLDLEDNKRRWSEKFNPDILQDSKPLCLEI